MSKYKIEDISNWTTLREIKCENRSLWVKCRPDNWKYETFSTKLKHAIGVLTGKYDVVDWGEQE